MRFCHLVSPVFLLEGKMVGRFLGLGGSGQKRNLRRAVTTWRIRYFNYTEPYQKIALQKDGGNYIAEP